MSPSSNPSSGGDEETPPHTLSPSTPSATRFRRLDSKTPPVRISGYATVIDQCRSFTLPTKMVEKKKIQIWKYKYLKSSGSLHSFVTGGPYM